MGTSAVLSAIEWRQPSRLPTTSSGDMQAAQTKAAASTSKLRFVTPDKENSMSTLWQEEEFEQICAENHLRERQQKLQKRPL